LSGGIDEGRLKKRLIELCRIAAPSRFEEPVRGYLHRFWEERRGDGLTWQEADSPPEDGRAANILLALDGKGGECVLLCAHIDTVPAGDAACINVIENDDVLRSDGTTILGGDDRAGVALALEMFDCLLETPEEARPPVEVLFTVQEELSLIGSRNIGLPLKAKICYCLDGETPPGSIITASPRKEQYTVEVRGKSAHAALEAREGRNAIVRAAKLAAAFPQGQVDEDTTANIGIFQGGTQANIVPDYVRILGEVRSFLPERFAAAKKAVDEACENAGADYTVSVRWEKSYGGYALPEDAGVVRRFACAAQKAGFTPVLLRSPGGSDANNLNGHGIESVVFGIGMHNIHTPNEYFVLAELYDAARILHKVVLREAMT
jgi:tripeptide aminopeptidase